MPALWLICPRCREASPPNTRYCAHCGEPLDPSLVKELRGLEWTLADLDARIAADKGGQTIVELRNEYYARYHESILAPWLRGTAARNQSASVGAADAPAAKPPISEVIPNVSAREFVTGAPPPVREPVTTAPVIPPPSPLPRTTIPIPAVTLPAAPVPPPPGPVFSWRAFSAEQAIAIMAYLGGKGAPGEDRARRRRNRRSRQRDRRDRDGRSREWTGGRNDRRSRHRLPDRRRRTRYELPGRYIWDDLTDGRFCSRGVRCANGSGLVSGRCSPQPGGKDGFMIAGVILVTQFNNRLAALIGGNARVQISQGPLQPPQFFYQ